MLFGKFARRQFLAKELPIKTFIMFIFVLSKIWANPDLFFVYFHPFLIQIEKSIDDVLWIQTQGRRMVGEDEATDRPN